MKSGKHLLLARIIYMIMIILSTTLTAQNLKKLSGTIFQSASIEMDASQKFPVEFRFHKNQKITAATFFQQYRKAFTWSEDNEAIKFKVIRDELGQTHYRFKQYYKGVELAEIQYLIHEEDNMVTYAHGKLIHDLDLDVNPKLSESEALQFALEYIGASSYMWENQKSEAILKKIKNNQKATYYPVGELKISSGLKPKVIENLKLVYRFDIFAAIPMNRNDVDVDANTGEIVGVIPRSYSDDVEGRGTTMYNGDVDIIVSDNNLEDNEKYPAYFHTDDWNAYGGTGTSWWMADTTIGTNGGYSDFWYQTLDTDPVFLYGEQVRLSFVHRFAGEAPSPPDQMPEGYDGWDGMNVRISIDNGETWQILDNPTPGYSNESLYGFGSSHGEGEGVPGWAGITQNWTEVNFDLSAYIDFTVRIRFAFASDPAVSTEFAGDPEWFGWQVDDIVIQNIGDTLFSNSGQKKGLTPKNTLFLSGNYRLREVGRGGGIETYDLQNQEEVWLAVDFVDDDTYFTDLNDRAGVSVHWAAEASYDYYQSQHGRNSFDDAGGSIVSYVHLGEDVFNAFWMGAFMVFGDGDVSNGYQPLVSVDVVGHELTHGVTQYSADLIYQDESGAINESFSDIFGEHIESFKTDGVHDWLIGGEFGALRSFVNPKSFNQPDTYFGHHWYTGDADNGGVHINSGVQNFWFYLLAEGGEGVNDNGDVYSVVAIGLEDVAKIAYRSLTVYLVPTSEYEDARRGSLNAALDLFGLSSMQFKSVLDAWNAVGVYYPFIGPFSDSTFTNKNYFVPETDTLIVVSAISNPKEHDIRVNILIESLDQSVRDSINLNDNGLNGDHHIGDGLWGGSWPVPTGEKIYSLTTRVMSLDSGYYNISKNSAFFTTQGPLALDKYEITSPDSVIHPGDMITVGFTLQNFGHTDTIYQVSSKTVSLDECTQIVAFSDPQYGDMAPGQRIEGSRPISIRFNDCAAPEDIRFALNIYTEEYMFWSDTFSIGIVAALHREQNTLPLEFALKQNYPNPFNPTTAIGYQLSTNSDVELSVYNVLGERIAVLVSENQKAGSYNIVWDASGFASGIYYYKIKAGEFHEVKKMTLIR